MKSPGRALIWSALAALVVVWGTTWAAIRVGLTGIPPFAGVALRFAIASVVLFGVAWLRGIRLESGRRIWPLWAVNTLLTFTLSYGVVYWAEQWVPSGLAAVLYTTFPFFVALLAQFCLPGERLTRGSLVGIGVGFAGVVVIFSEDLAAIGGQRTYLAAAVFLVSPCAAAVANVVVKKRGVGVHPLSLIAVPMGLTALIMGALSLAVERDVALVFDLPSVGALLYLAVMGSAFTFTVYFWLLQHLPATRLSFITYAIPVVAVLVGTLVLDEPFTLRMLAGALLVVAGVVLAVRRPRAGPLQGD